MASFHNYTFSLQRYSCHGTAPAEHYMLVEYIIDRTKHWFSFVPRVVSRDCVRAAHALVDGDI